MMNHKKSVLLERERALFCALAHDLKTPLTIARGNAELLSDTALTEEQQECAQYIEASVAQMQDYVQALIEATKSWDNTRLRMQDIQIDSLLREVKRQIGGLCSIKGIALHWNCERRATHFTSDRDLFIRALVNILSNAAEHTTKGGVVSLSVREENGKLLFIADDSGSGFT